MPKLRYLGHSAFYVEGTGLKALIDPFLTGNPLAAAKAADFTDVNAIFLTHCHGDHIGDTVEIAKRTGATVFTCNETAGWLASQGIRVIVAGLDMDYTGRPFGPMPALMAVAEHVTKVHAICVRCGDPAQYSHRLKADPRLVMLGEKESYEPLCRHCFEQVMAEEHAAAK